jgi:hypothetical protein
VTHRFVLPDKVGFIPHRCKGCGVIAAFGEMEREQGVSRYHKIISDALHTLITALLPPSCAVHLTEVSVAQDYVLLQLTATVPTAPMPVLYGAVVLGP